MITRFTNARIVTENGVVEGALTLKDGTIERISSSDTLPKAGETVLDCKDRYLLPGFFDSHLHAMDLFEVLHGHFSLDTLAFTETDDAVPQVLKRLPRTGVTSCMLSSMAAPDRLMEKFFSAVQLYCAAPDTASARFMGVDLEGNFLKDPAFSGMQDAANIKTPDIDLFEKWQALCGGQIRKALIAPEWGEPAFRLIRHLADHGLCPSVGHTGCTREQLMKAYDCGTRVVVHTGNGPMSQNFKSGGALDAVFHLGPALYAEIIADLTHVHPHWINTFLNGFTFDRVLGISDATHLAGAPIQDGTVIGNTVIRDGALWSTEKANTLAGSVSTVDRQFNNMVNLLTGDRTAYFHAVTPAPYALAEALPRASRLYSLNPARCFGCDDRIGSLAPGKAADLVLADITGAPGAWRVRIERVFIAGREVFSA
ncbi:MAG: amidohydrolase family protein [Fibrobacterota bacterium]